ncbi:MAG: DUF4923 family protein [Muribaculaceae bacterium]|nr:DUF4923 family protein [Muribaculaceae bacterium]
MKKSIASILVLLISLCSFNAMADSPLSGLGSLLQGLGQSRDTTSTGSSTGKSGGLGDIISGVTGALGLGNSKASIESLSGTWTYNGPAVTFKSDNFLLKAGGAAAAATVEKKLEPYYKTAGLTSLTITINPDSTFTFKAKKASLGGTITRDDVSGQYVFNFRAFKKINVGSMEAYISLNGKNAMELTFDVSKLITIIQKVGAITGNSTIKGVSSLLGQYDGMTAGFDLKKTAAATDATTGATTR